MSIVQKRVAVVGSRTFDDKARLYEVLTKNRERIKLIVSGGAKGADTLATLWASDYGIPYLVFPALWRDPDTGVYNKGAGFKRNVKIIEQADVVIAFWDGVSSGTKHSIDMAERAGKPVKIIRFTQAAPVDVSKLDFQEKHGHCCTAEAMQDQHDFYEAQAELASGAVKLPPPQPVETPKVSSEDIL
jgi:hypothetical protein